MSEPIYNYQIQGNASNTLPQSYSSPQATPNVNVEGNLLPTIPNPGIAGGILLSQSDLSILIPLFLVGIFLIIIFG